MTCLSRADLIAVLSSLLSGRVRFDDVRQFVFQFFEGQKEVRIDEDLELVFSGLAPYLEHEEAYGDDDRAGRMRRLRDALSLAGAPVERTVWALEFDRIKELQQRLDSGAIAQAMYEIQLRQMSPADFDVPKVARWAAAQREYDEFDLALTAEEEPDSVAEVPRAER